MKIGQIAQTFITDIIQQKPSSNPLEDPTNKTVHTKRTVFHRNPIYTDLRKTSFVALNAHNILGYFFEKKKRKFQNILRRKPANNGSIGQTAEAWQKYKNA